MNNPAISVAIVMDSPTAGGSYYGAAGQRAGLPRRGAAGSGIPGRAARYRMKPAGAVVAAGKDLDEAPPEHTGDLTALFADVNNLPADDPLRDASRRRSSKMVASSLAGTAATTAQPEKLMVAAKRIAGSGCEDAELLPLGSAGNARAVRRQGLGGGRDAASRSRCRPSWDSRCARWWSRRDSWVWACR